MDELRDMSRQVAALRQAAENLTQLGRDFPALARNAVRVLACVRMMELNLPQDLEPAAEP